MTAMEETTILRESAGNPNLIHRLKLAWMAARDEPGRRRMSEEIRRLYTAKPRP